MQRWLKFVKYLQNFDIEPIVYTVDNPNYPITDNSLFDDVPKDITILKQPIFEVNNLFGKNNKQSAGFLKQNPSFIGKCLQYIRANYFIPDARKYWIKPSVNYLKKYLQSNKIDIIISTGPPHSMHLIAMQLKKELNIKWIADFRDPWTDIDYFHQLPLTKNAKKKHQHLEQKVLNNADAVLVVGKTMKENYKQFSKNIHVITNGYDVDELESIALDTKFSIVHIGLMNTDRNPKSLWKILSEIALENKGFKNDLEIKLIGKVDASVLESFKKFNLTSNVNLIDYVPNKEVLKHQQSAQVLLLPVNNVPSSKGIITGKIFEYLVANRPILAIAPTDGDLADIINDTVSGKVIDFNDENQLKKTILEYYNLYKQNALIINSKNIEKYHRKELTKQLSNVIKQLVS